MYSVATIANRIIQFAQDKGISLTPLQLMKLVYMSHGWSLGILNQPLFPEQVEAWRYGPVIPSLYHKTKTYGSGPITELLRAPLSDQMDDQTDNLLKAVVDNYAMLSGPALSNLTHREGSPWSRVWSDQITGVVIPNQYIQEHYAKLKDSPTVTSA